MQEGNIVLVSLPQADGNFKLRPALLRKELPKYDDFIVCGISSQLHQFLEGIDEIINTTDSYFQETGLRISSVVRLLYLAVIPTSRIAGGIGRLPLQLHQELLQRLSKFLNTNQFQG